MNNYDFLNTNNSSFLSAIDLMPNTNNMNYNINNNANSNSNNNQTMLNTYGPYEGYIKGNMFKNLYSQYKNYKPYSITPASDEEEALLNLNQIQFAMHELNLYLDVYPNDNTAMTNFKALRNTYNNLLNDYENRFGAILVNSEYINNTPFVWSSTSWPWNGGNM